MPKKSRKIKKKALEKLTNLESAKLFIHDKTTPQLNKIFEKLTRNSREKSCFMKAASICYVRDSRANTADTILKKLIQTDTAALPYLDKYTLANELIVKAISDGNFCGNTCLILAIKYCNVAMAEILCEADVLTKPKRDNPIIFILAAADPGLPSPMCIAYDLDQLFNIFKMIINTPAYKRHPEHYQ